jgi:SAM-dependent methyltransferase
VRAEAVSATPRTTRSRIDGRSHALATGDIALEDGSQLRYGCELASLPAELAARFIALEHDHAAQRFVRQALARPHGWLASACYGVLRRVLSDYDAYGLLGMYPMHLLSREQFQRSLAQAGARPGGSLLDVGAGNGAITALAAPGFDRVLVTEASAVMRARLRRRGYRVLEHDLGRERVPDDARADAVLALNVLDRTSHPRTMLAHLRDALRPNGVLMLSLPLPLRPHVQHAGGTADPEELLPSASGDGWEAAAARLVLELFVPAGLEVCSLSRVPYLSRGDRERRLYVLDAALFVARASVRRTTSVLDAVR